MIVNICRDTSFHSLLIFQMATKQQAKEAIRKVIILYFFLFLSVEAFSQAGIITGTVTGANNKERLPGAFVSLSKLNIKKAADNEGAFQFSNIPAGDYDLTIEYVGYLTTVRHITIKQGETLKIDIAISPDTKKLGEVFVFGKLNQEEDAGARLKEKKSNNIINVVSAKAMERSPDINAANVLQRVSGVTIQRNGGGDEAYPIVRGLDPRYSNTLINGIKVTSPDDKSRSVSLNVVPSDLLGSIEVHKTLLPEMEGDAISGSVNMVMKDAPDKEVFRVLGSLGYSKIFIDRKFVNFSKADIQQKSVIEKYGNTYTAQPNDFSRTNLDFQQTVPLPNYVAGLVYGHRVMNGKLGFLIAVNSQGQYYGSNSIFNQVAPDVHSGGAATISDYANRSFSTPTIQQRPHDPSRLPI